jgi:hypothetical protein
LYFFFKMNALQLITTICLSEFVSFLFIFLILLLLLLVNSMVLDLAFKLFITLFINKYIFIEYIFQQQQLSI